MVNRCASLDLVFGALADPTRRAMLRKLAKSGASIGELGGSFEITKPAVTKHVKVLERAGLLVREIDGRVHRCRLDPQPLATAQDWVAAIRTFWERQLDELAAYLASVQKEPTS